jgi:hypothetical protein
VWPGNDEVHRRSSVLRVSALGARRDGGNDTKVERRQCLRRGSLYRVRMVSRGSRERRRQ